MTFTFWHSGILIGESDLEEAGNHPGQRGGIFRPTVYGLEAFPRLSGMLSAAAALKTQVEERGFSPETIAPREIAELLDTTDAGQKVIDIGRMLSEVEIRAADGRRLEFASIAFSDLLEIQRLARELAIADLDYLDEVKELPPDAPRFIVSATFRAGSRTQR